MSINTNLKKKYEDKGFKYPVAPYIARLDETKKFLDAEGKLVEYIKKTVDEFIALYKEKNLYQNKWKEAIPEVLRGILERFETDISEIVAISYLEKRGFNIQEPAE